MPKAKRTLSNIDFSNDDSHIALVSKEQGGPANGAAYALVMKANNFSPEFIEKASKVKVTMDIQDFLTRFYHMYYEDAEVLARALGYDTERESVEDYEEYIDKKVESIEIIKSLREEQGRDLKLAELNEEQYLSLLKSQSELEVVLEKSKSSGESENAGNSTSVVENVNVEPTGSDNVEKSNMTLKTEMVEKSQLVAVEKALADTKELLTKALADIEVFKAAQKEALTKARFAKLLDAVKDNDKAENLFKALSLIEDEASFDSTVETLAQMTATIEKSSLFEEKGASAAAESAPVESAVTKAVKARLAAKKSKE